MLYRSKFPNHILTNFRCVNPSLYYYSRIMFNTNATKILSTCTSPLDHWLVSYYRLLLIVQKVVISKSTMFLCNACPQAFTYWEKAWGWDYLGLDIKARCRPCGHTASTGDSQLARLVWISMWSWEVHKLKCRQHSVFSACIQDHHHLEEFHHYNARALLYQLIFTIY